MIPKKRKKLKVTEEEANRALALHLPILSELPSFSSAEVVEGENGFELHMSVSGVINKKSVPKYVNIGSPRKIVKVPLVVIEKSKS